MKSISCRWSESRRRDYASRIQIVGAQPILLDSSQSTKTSLLQYVLKLLALPLPKRKHEVYTDTHCV